MSSATLFLQRHATRVTPPPPDQTSDREYMISSVLIVIYWLSTELSIKRCTCVNKRRNSESRWTKDNYITRCHRRLGSVPVAVGASWGQDAGVRASGRQRVLGPQWPTVEQPQPRWESAAMARRTWGQNKCVPVSNSPLTHNQHQPFRE